MAGSAVLWGEIIKRLVLAIAATVTATLHRVPDLPFD